jgi:hypothetical protein
MDKMESMNALKHKLNIKMVLQEYPYVAKINGKVIVTVKEI